MSTEGEGAKPPSTPTREIRLPDLGTPSEVTVVELLVKVGDAVEKDTPLVTLESDKASMDVPSPMPGTIEKILVRPGDKVATGTAIMELAGAPQLKAEEVPMQGRGPRQPEPFGGEPYVSTVPIKPLSSADLSRENGEQPARASAPEPAPAAGSSTSTTKYDFDVAVIGAGPGGYTAAFRAADLGLKVVLVDRWPTLGGVCLNVGCIPSKALLHAAKVIEEARAMAEHGVAFGPPQIDAARLRDWKNGVVARLTGGLTSLAKQRKVTVLRGVATFESDHALRLAEDDGATRTVSFTHCIVAAGSESLRLPGLPDDPRRRCSA